MKGKFIITADEDQEGLTHLAFEIDLNHTTGIDRVCLVHQVLESLEILGNPMIELAVVMGMKTGVWPDSEPVANSEIKIDVNRLDKAVKAMKDKQ